MPNHDQDLAQSQILGITLSFENILEHKSLAAAFLKAKDAYIL